MWNDLVSLGVSAPEKILRTIVVYVALAVLLRLAGKRDLAQLNSFDLVVMLLLSNVVQNAVIGPDNSLAGGLLGAAVLVGFNAVMVRLSVRSDRTFRVMEGTPTVLARDGQWDRQTLRRLGLREADIEAALRRQNANDVSEAERVTLEPGGAVVATVAPAYQTPTKADVDRLAARLRQVEGETVARLEAKLDELLARTAPA
ncbi:MAG TPA: YetF domain-containing protein [Nocardioidaceae bacterium]|nr:YetF domain-containing protein [Nocardioidaceae bacterium]